MLLHQRIDTQRTIVEALATQLKSARAELKKLERKQTKLEALTVLTAELSTDPDTADSLPGASATSQPALAPRLIEILSDEPTRLLRVIEIEEVATTTTKPDSGAWADIEDEDDAPPSLDEAAPLDESKLKAQADAEKKAAKLSQIAVEAATITVRWLTENTGITIDAEGIERTFTCDNWAATEPVFSLMTRAGKEIKSTWKNPGIESSRHFFALEKSLHSHFLGVIEAAGFKLERVDSETNARAYDAYWNGQKIGRIREGLFEDWLHNLQRVNYAVTPRRNIIECLQDLRQSFSNKQAENIKFIADNTALAHSMLNRAH